MGLGHTPQLGGAPQADVPSASRALGPSAPARARILPNRPPQASAPLRRPWRTGFQSLRRLSGRRLGGASSLPAGSACAERLPRRGAGSGRRRGAPRVGRGVTGSSLGRGGRDGGGASVPRVSSGPRRWGAGGPRRPFPAGEFAGRSVCGLNACWCLCCLVPGTWSVVVGGLELPRFLCFHLLNL